MATIFIILSIFVLYKLLVDFIIPIYRASKRVQAQFRNMQQSRETPQDAGFTRPRQAAPKKTSADYIDFEEIKD